MATLPNPFFADAEPDVEQRKSAPVSMGSLPSGESDPAVTPDFAGADTFAVNFDALFNAIDQQSVDWDPLPAFIAEPRPEYLEHMLQELGPIAAAHARR
jgi:hypothetical protein